MNLIDVKESPLSAGRDRMLRYLAGEKLGRKDAIIAKCFECSNGYLDGRADCEIPGCPLYPYMPYRKNLIQGGKNEQKSEG